MKNYIVMDPSKQSAKYVYYGPHFAEAMAAAKSINERTGLLVPIDYEVITRSGAVKETGGAWPKPQ